MSFALFLPEYQKNLSSDLTALQQNGEFVDMTLAADGHLVKVHQILVALASPYLKELIKSVQCPQPVIFLNNVSYSTLCYLLEYIYTGEVQVPVENIKQVLEAGKALHIKGLQDMDIQQDNDTFSVQNTSAQDNVTVSFSNTGGVYGSKMKGLQPDPENTFTDSVTFDHPDMASDDDGQEAKITTPVQETPVPTIQYTLSNRGSLQMILNRFMYYMKYSSRRNSVRQWRCVDYIDSRCPAFVVTKDDAVVKRIAAHNHPYHDKRIIKKNHVGAIFTALQEAEEKGQSQKKRISTEKKQLGPEGIHVTNAESQ